MSPLLSLALLTLSVPICQESADLASGQALTVAEQAAFTAAAELSEQQSGLALVVRRGGEIVFERYAPGFGPDKPAPLEAGTRAFWGLAAVAAVEDGLFALDEKLSDSLSEWRGAPLKESISVRALLELSSGLDASGRKLSKPTTRDRFAVALEAQALEPEGKTFRNGPTAYYVFGAFLERKLASRGEDALAYLRRRVLDPIGLQVALWGRDPAGHVLMADGAYLTAREWSKLGQLVLDQGRVGERQLIQAVALARCFQPSAANPGFGLSFWLFPSLAGAHEPDGMDSGDEAHLESGARGGESLAGLPADLVYAAGLGRQRLYVIPSRDLVVVRLGVPGDKGSEVGWLRVLLGVDPQPEKDSAPKGG